MKIRTIGLLICVGWLAAGAEVLRVPEDYDRVQRAVTAAAPGDTVRIGAGDFVESLVVTKAVTLRGEGAEATRLVGVSRDWPVIILGSSDGAVVLEDFALVHPAAAAAETTEGGQSYGAAAGISMWAGGAKLRGLRIENVSGAGVQVGGRARLEWSGATAAQRAAIEWLEGAAPDAPPPPPVTDEDLLNDRALFELRQTEDHLRATEPARRAAARALQTALRADSGVAAQAAALETFLHAMLDSYTFRLPRDEQADALINDEVRAFVAKHGMRALAAAAAAWKPNETFGDSWENYFSLRMEPALWEQWTALAESKPTGENAERIAAAFARLENPPADDAKAAAEGFQTTLRELAALVAEAEAAGRVGDLKEIFVSRVKEATPGFVTKAGYPALARVLRLVAADPDSLVKAPDLQAVLTPEQRRELLRAMRNVGP